MKNVVLSLVGLLMFVGCGDEWHVLMHSVDPEAEELWVCEDTDYIEDPDEISMPSTNQYYYSLEDCKSVGCFDCYGGWNPL